MTVVNVIAARRSRAYPLCICILVLLSAPGLAQVSPAQVRTTIMQRVGDINLLRVPADNLDLPQPTLSSGEIDPRYKITEAKRYLGKLLFNEPSRSTDVDAAEGGNPAFRMTASCASCHLALGGSKAGQLFNFGVGGSGRILMDTGGNFTIERTQAAGSVDAIPTGLVKLDTAGNEVLNGARDEVDSVGRIAPSIVGLAFNQRLLLDGVAGESNPEALPAGEHLVQLASMNHRMFEDQHVEIQPNPVYRELFARAFPEENAVFQVSGDISDLISSDTIQRAIATFIRATITRDTSWDRFLAGDDNALTASQLEGAYLFVASTAGGGANCIACHSGPALNKVLGDEAGILVEENFFNIGVNDHPLHEMAREVLEDPNYHDIGRQFVTGDPADAYEFRTLTLRQLKGSGPMMHGGDFETMREVVEYFNAGIPLNPLAEQAGTVTALFTQPRGPSAPPGLGLLPEQVDALADFVENGLYDPAFVFYDPNSLTVPFDLTSDDLDYAPDLEALGAEDGFLPTLRTVANDDPLSIAQTMFVRGGINDDDRVNIADAVFLLNYLFGGKAAPVATVAADVNDDRRVNVADVIYLLLYLFDRGSEPPAPFPHPGQLFLTAQ